MSESTAERILYSPSAAEVAALRRRKKRRQLLRSIVLYVTVAFLSLTFALPFLWMLSTSLKDDPQVYRVPPIWIPHPVRLRNYPEALTKQPFDLFFLNTLKYAIPSAFGAVLSSSLAAYGFARLRWWGRDVLFFICIATMMIPFQVVMIPLYIIFKDFGWLNSYKALVIPTFFGNAYYIFLLRQFFMSIPQEISDAARVDGAGEIGIFVRIILPLAKPALAVVALFQFMGAWNDYLGPLIYLNREELYPIALGLQLFRSQFQEKLVWPYLMAASTVTILPVIIIFFFTQRTFVEGITVTGLKG
ncbi:MAG: carbohydrate ABC transporter permease [Anaerolineae bacterium]|nr:carbohydrate ABC transporter permease [Anaerolineae bacterium]